MNGSEAFTLDIPTLAFTRSLIQIMLGGLVAFIGYHDKEAKGPRFWATALVINGLALFTFPFTIASLETLLTTTNHLAIGVSACLFMVGFWRFNQQKTRWAFIYLILSSVFFSLVVWHFVFPNARYRIIMTASAQLLSYLVIQHSLRTPYRPELKSLSNGLRMIILAYSVIFVWSYARVIGILPLSASVTPDYHRALFSIASLLFMLSLAVGCLGLQFLRLSAINGDLAISDWLTGLLNRRGLMNLTHHDDARRRRELTTNAVICFDIDKFKTINDQYGHIEGDRILKAFSDILRKNIREQDLTARTGGEEFVVILIGANEQIAMEKAELIRVACRQTEVRLGDGTRIHFSISAGVVEYSWEVLSHEAIELADKALYEAKRLGRDRVVCHLLF